MRDTKQIRLLTQTLGNTAAHLQTCFIPQPVTHAGTLAGPGVVVNVGPAKRLESRRFAASVVYRFCVAAG